VEEIQVIRLVRALRATPLAALGLFAAVACGAEALDAKRTAEVAAVVQEWLHTTGAPSVSVAIAEHGRPVYAQAFGAAKLSTPPVPATVQSRYAVDSVSKEFTAAALLILQQRHQLSLDDRLEKWFPELNEARAVTLRQLLNHTSGIRDYWPQDFVTPEMSHPVEIAALIREWAARPLDFEPGTDWQYSNTNYVLAGVVAERVAGKPLLQFLQDAVFAPLRMAHVVSRDAVDTAGYTRFGLGPILPAPAEGHGWLFGAAELAMPASDLIAWDLSLMNRSLLDPKSYDALFDPVVLKNGTSKPYALGLAVERIDGRLRVSHGGAGSGFLAENSLWPEEKIAIAVFTNNDWASPAELRERLSFIMLPANKPQARAAAMFRNMQSGTVDRSQFSGVGNFGLSDAALRDLHASLGSLGPARLIALEHESQRGGLTTRIWKILCADARLQAVERSQPDGLFDEFMVTLRQD
jgi:D-alanyl-D-alanine carboxypeptidase